jgi:hypothetical protein
MMMVGLSRLRAVLLTVGALAAVQVGASTASADVQSTVPVCAQPDGHVDASALSAGVLYIGGSFSHVKDLSGRSQPRGGLAAIDASSCDLLPWRADANKQVYALAVHGGTVYAGGAFTAVSGKSRYGVAALDASSGAVLSFAPHVSGTVRALTTNGTSVYAGGSFRKVNGSSRSHLAAFDDNTGALSGTWKPTASGTVRALVPSANGGRIYVGGTFSALDGKSGSGYLGAVDPTTGRLDAGFSPKLSFPVLSLDTDSNGVYTGGGGAGGHLAIWNPDGSLQQPVYQTDGDVQAIAVDGGTVYGGGHFDNYCVGNTGSGAPYICNKPLVRHKLFAVSLGTGAVTSWAPKLNSNLGVFTEAVDAASGDLWVGGDFTTVNGVSQPHVAVFR